MTSPVPIGTWQHIQPCDAANLTHNSCGFHPTLVEKGWDWCFARGFFGEPSLDECLPRFPNFAIMRAHGEAASPPVVGYYPPNVNSGMAVRCEPRGPQDLRLAESIVPGFWKALAPRIAKAHAMGGRAMVYYATPPLDLFPANLLTRHRNAILDELIRPAVEAGMGPTDLIACDACAACSQRPAKTDGMYFAERVLHHGIGFCVESHEQVHPDLYPWFDGRFSCLSGRFTDRANSRWDLAVENKGWFGPGANHAIKEHFCSIQGGSEGPDGTLSDRIALIPPGVVNGSPVRTILKMGDLPWEWVV